MLDRLLPAFVATAETTEDLLDVKLYPEERDCVGDACTKRIEEFVTGRACARLALEKLGIPAVPIVHGPGNEPVWPDGIVGAITHSTGFRACAVARGEHARSLGIDAEPNAPLPSGLIPQVAFGRELGLQGHCAGACLDRLLFSAKEAVYKAWYQLTKHRLGFEQIEVLVDVRARSFTAFLRVEDPRIRTLGDDGLIGRWGVANGILCTAVVIR